MIIDLMKLAVLEIKIPSHLKNTFARLSAALVLARLNSGELIKLDVGILGIIH